MFILLAIKAQKKICISQSQSTIYMHVGDSHIQSVNVTEECNLFIPLIIAAAT